MKKTLLTLTLLGHVLFVNAALTISTPGNSDIIYFGNPNTATYGQSFTAPVGDNKLDSWTFSLKNAGSSSQNLQFFVMAWDGNKAQGPVLYQSATAVVTSSSYQDFTFLPNLTLTPGAAYVAFINESGLNSVNGQVAMRGNSADVYSGGSFRYLNNGDNFSAVTSSTWNNYSIVETAFTAEFSSVAAVPEPSTYLAGALLLLPFAGNALRSLRSRKQIA